MLERCLICEGAGNYRREPCRFCAGTGRITVVRTVPTTVLMATGSCKVPVRKVVLDGGLIIGRRSGADE